jgi:prevent-host-death family protein
MARRSTGFVTEFSRARDHLTDLMNEAVHRHHPVVIDRHQGKEIALLIGAEDAKAWLEPLAVETQMPLEVVEEGDETIVTATRLGLMGSGESVLDALEELADEIEDYAGAFFGNYDFYRQTPDGELAPWLLRFFFADPEDQIEILLAPLVEGRMNDRVAPHDETALHQAAAR